MTDPRLFTLPPAVADLLEQHLTPNQHLVWEAVKMYDGGISADEAGAILHAAKGRHDTGERCEWCAADGRSVLSSAGLRQLVKYRRTPEGRLYVPRVAATTPSRELPGESWEDIFGDAA